MSDLRRVRFATLGVLTRDDLPLAVDVWLGDALAAPWATRETMKLSGILTHYILEPSPEQLSFSAIEDSHHVSRDHARRALSLMALYGLIDGFNTAAGELKVALRLSPLQMLRILDAKRRLEDLETRCGSGGPAGALGNQMRKPVEPPWIPDEIELPVTAEGPVQATVKVGRTAGLLRKKFAAAIEKDKAGSEDKSPAT